MIKKDYCTYSPDTIGETYIGDLCAVHDVAYWKGGTKKDKKIADVILRKSITKRINWVWGWIYYIGVRFFGAKHFSFK